MPRSKANATTWRKGQSGNPAGRKAGTATLAPLREQIAEHLPEIIGKLVELAKGGDVAACRVLLERCIPVLKPAELPAPLALPADAPLPLQGAAVLAATAAGDLAPGQGAEILGALASQAKLIEADELERRITAIEQALEQRGTAPAADVGQAWAAGH
jgi:hypothetical protein